MGLNHRTRVVILVILAALWLIGVVATTITVSVPLFYLLPVLAVFSFFLTDYFSVFVMAVLLTSIARTLYLDQLPDTTRAFIVDSIWIAAFVSVGFKLLKAFNSAMADQHSRSPLIPQWPLTTIAITGPLPANLRHDLQAPLRLILGYCQATFRYERDQVSTVPPLVSGNIQAIYRNAQHLEQMLAGFLNQLTSAHTSAAEELEPAVIIQESVAMVRELLMTFRTKLALNLDDPLPKLRLHRITLRQILLNVLRSIIRANGQQGTEALVNVSASVQEADFHITFSVASTSIQHVVTDPLWKQTDRLAEIVGGRLGFQKVAESADSQIILTFPSPKHSASSVVESSLTPRMPDKRSILVIAEESEISDFFKEQFSHYNVIGITDIRTAAESVTRVKPVAIILTRKQYRSQIKALSDLVSERTPIIMCPIATTRELLQQLDVDYLPKPVDYGALMTILTSASVTVTQILIVDDNMDSAQMLALMLSSISPAVVTHKSYLARDALTLLDNQPIDAIIVDVTLPDMDGITLVQEIRTRERFAQVPIVLVSAQENLEAMLPITITNEVTIFQWGGIEPARLAAYIGERV